MDSEAAVAEEDERRFGAAVRRYREEAGWSQGELARRLNDLGWKAFHQTTISRIEKGERPIRLSEAKGFQKVFGRSEWEFAADPERVVIERHFRQISEAYLNLLKAAEEYAGELSELAARFGEYKKKMSPVQLAVADQFRQSTPLEVVREALVKQSISADELSDKMRDEALGRDTSWFDRPAPPDPEALDRDWLTAIYDVNPVFPSPENPHG